MITVSRFRAAFAVLFPLALAACSGGGGAEAPAAASGSATASGASAQAAAAPASAASAPPVSVSVVVALQRDFPVSVRATGTVSPLASVDVKSQVSSIVTKVHVKEGQFVRAGEPLFTLDARTDEANLGKAQAQLARDQATLADAKRQLERSRDLLSRNFVSQGAVDTAQANVEAQQAAVQADLAAIEAVKVSLSYARISAPSGGRVGAVNVFPGTSVSPTAPVLATITQLDPIAVSFNLPQRHVNDALRLLSSGSGANVTAVLPDGKGQRQGRLQFVDSQIDAASGTVKVKAGFDNRDHVLWPGAYADIVLTVQTLAGAIVIPQAALVTNPRGNVVFIVGPDNRAVLRPVSVLQSAGADAVVEGLKAGDRVVVDGRQNLRPGSALVVRDGSGSGAGRPGRGASGPGRGASAPGAARSPA